MERNKREKKPEPFYCEMSCRNDPLALPFTDIFDDSGQNGDVFFGQKSSLEIIAAAGKTLAKRSDLIKLEKIIMKKAGLKVWP